MSLFHHPNILHSKGKKKLCLYHTTLTCEVKSEGLEDSGTDNWVFKGAQLPNCDSLTSKGALFREHFPETERLQFGRFSNPLSEPSSTLKREREEGEKNKILDSELISLQCFTTSI